MKGGTRKRGKTWSYYFDTAQVGGKRKKIEKGGFRTKKEAETALAKAIAEYESSGQVFQPSTISVSDYLDFWYEQYCKMNLTENTQQTYATLIHRHLKPQFGAYYLKSLQTAAIQEYINQLKAQGYSKATIRSIFVVLSTAIDYAVQPLQYIRENPCRFVKIGTVAKPVRERIVLTDAEFDRIRKRFPVGSRYYIPLMIGWNCGLRINECFALTWDDVDFENCTLSVERQLIRRNINGNLGFSLKGPKYNSKRKIKFGESLYRILKAEKNRQLKNELKYGEFYTVYQLVDFTDEKGAPRQRIVGTQKILSTGARRINFICVDENGELTTKNSFAYCQRVIRQELGINFDYHSLRHTHATKLIEAGANVKAVQQRLGHKNIVTTMNTYVHHTDEMAQTAADLFESVVNGLPPK